MQEGARFVSEVRIIAKIQLTISIYSILDSEVLIHFWAPPPPPPPKLNFGTIGINFAAIE